MIYQIDADELISGKWGRLLLPEQDVLDGRTGAFVRFHKGDFVSWPASVEKWSQKSRRKFLCDLLGERKMK